VDSNCFDEAAQRFFETLGVVSMDVVGFDVLGASADIAQGIANRPLVLLGPVDFFAACTTGA
jgi:hypothetical protein